MQRVHPKRRYTGTELHSVAYQQIVVLALTDMSTANLTRGTGFHVT